MESGETSRRGFKETLVYLDFNDKLLQELLDDKIFIRIVNIEDKNPLVQINDMVFKGTYDYSIGTNLFFKKTPNQGLSEFPFQQPIKYQLDFLEAQTKILNCKQMRVPPTTATLPESKGKIHYNFKWDYEELLNKFEQGTLDLKDMTEQQENELPQEIVSNICEAQNVELPTPIEPDECENVEMVEPDESPLIEIPEEPYEELKVAYENLQMLARIPVKRNCIAETVACDPKYSRSYDYRSIECKVLDPPPFSYFRDHKNFDKDNIYDCVDINRCARLGIIAPSNNCPRTLTKDEKKRVFTMENFENLSLTARYSVLLSSVRGTAGLEQQVESNNSEENSTKDKFGHTPSDTLEIFKKLLASLQTRIQEVS